MGPAPKYNQGTNLGYDLLTRHIQYPKSGVIVLSGVNGCAISPSGEWIVSCSNDETLKIWDVHTGEERMTLKGHTDVVSGCAISPSGEWIVSCSADHALKVWDAHTGIMIITLRVDTPLYACSFTPDGEHIIAGGVGGVYFLRIVR